MWGGIEIRSHMRARVLMSRLGESSTGTAVKTYPLQSKHGNTRWGSLSSTILPRATGVAGDLYLHEVIRLASSIPVQVKAGHI
jgi:hypothetical protein